MTNILQYINKLSSRLDSREKAIVILGIIGAVAIIAYGTVLAPLTDRYITLDRMNRQKESQYKDFIKLREEYSALKKEYEGLEKGASKAKEGFSPLTFMEGISTQAKIRDKVVSMKPRLIPIGENFRESSIEVKIERVVLEQVMTYLHLIEGSVYPLKVRTLHIRSRFDDPGLMDASVVVSFYEKVK